jgi:hypothetical protein
LLFEPLFVYPFLFHPNSGDTRRCRGDSPLNKSKKAAVALEETIRATAAAKGRKRKMETG